MQPYQDSQDTEQQRKARRAQAQRLRRAAQSAEQRAAVAAADAARHAAARYICKKPSAIPLSGGVQALGVPVQGALGYLLVSCCSMITCSSFEKCKCY